MPETTCAVDGCDRKSHARGWCGRHYRSWKKYGDPTRAIRQGTDQPVATCDVEGCAKQAHSRGWCKRHYESWRKRGTPTAVDDEPLRIAE